MKIIKDFINAFKDHLELWKLITFIIVVGIIALSVGAYINGSVALVLLIIGVCLSVSTFFGTLGATMYEQPMGVLFGLIGGLFFGTYLAFFLGGPHAAFFASYTAPAVGVIIGYFIPRYIDE